MNIKCPNGVLKVSCTALIFFLLTPGKAVLPSNLQKNNSFPANGTVQRGDVDNSGTVDIVDLLSLLKILSGTDPSSHLSDIDGNWDTDVLDLLALIQILGGKVKESTPYYEKEMFCDSSLVRDVDFNKYLHFLLVDTSLISTNYIRFLERDGAPLKDEGLRPVRIRVFRDDGSFTNNGLVRPGFLFVDPDNPGSAPYWDREFGHFDELLINKDFILEQCGLVISLPWIDGREKIGVIYETVGGARVGEIRNDTLRMKLIESATMSPYQLAGHGCPSMLRNVYSFGEVDPLIYDISNINVRIFARDDPSRYEEGGRAFSQIFGLDRDGDGRLDPDNVDYARGLIFFPMLEPFNLPFDSSGNLFNLSDRNSLIYNENDPERLLESHKYTIKLFIE
ncbi:MAG TPA: hypothetical protein VM123_18270 [archaeon]|nr:hypothetical protein [archaeon]